VVGVLIITHGPLANALLESSAMLIGENDHVETLSLAEGCDMAELNSRILESIQKLDTGSGVLILTDLFAGTPSNMVLRGYRSIKTKCECISGANLSMVLEVLEDRERPLDEIKKSAIAEGKDAIRDLFFEISEKVGRT
jgi:PTS system mannose-specific IIA component